MMDGTQAQDQASALLAAASASPCKQVAANLRARGREWAKAASSLKAAEGDELAGAEIALAGTLEAGCRLYRDDWAGPVIIVRINWQGGIPSLLTRDDETGREQWWNTMGPATPVVMVG